MKYLKLFEDLEDDEELYYEEITQDEYYEEINKSRLINPGEENTHLRSFTKKEKDIIKSWIISNYNNRMKNGITGVKFEGINHELTLSKLKDDWFLVSFEGKGINIKFKCDQWHGFIQCMEYLKKNDWANIFIK